MSRPALVLPQTGSKRPHSGAVGAAAGVSGMIVRPKPGLKDILFTINGSILPRVGAKLVTIAIITMLAIVCAQLRPGMLAQISGVPFTLIGIALSVFMSFRNNACYDRWWEGRKLWGQLIISCRAFARQASALAEPDRRFMLTALSEFAASLAASLRGTGKMVGAEERLNSTDLVLQGIGRRCLALMAADAINPVHYSVLEGQLTLLSQVQGGCERIANTPVPFAYSLLLHRTAYTFCLTLPFALAGNLGWWTLLPVLLVSYTFFGLDALSDQLEDPFGVEPNDLRSMR
ncbi:MULTISPECIES: bestrophin family protein [Sphingomonas]|nr:MULTISPECIES: bestrophin family protein [Sphingomonas]MBB3589629.1 putative membrane protein [Sphingomonas sp. BK481]